MPVRVCAFLSTISVAWTISWRERVLRARDDVARQRAVRGVEWRRGLNIGRRRAELAGGGGYDRHAKKMTARRACSRLGGEDVAAASLNRLNALTAR